MGNLNISVFDNEIFSEILKELKIFSNFTIKNYDNLNLCVGEAKKNKSLLIYFPKKDVSEFKEFKESNFPILIITKFKNLKISTSNSYVEKIIFPLRILDLMTKITSLFAKFEFKTRSIISISDYIIDKNERKIKKDKLELKLTEKETNFLILFSVNKKPISRNFLLKNVWHYSPSSDTHTIETHIHRLRKKILKKFGDSNLIKNNKNGYFI